jgi:hypothetical protein
MQAQAYLISGLERSDNNNDKRRHKGGVRYSFKVKSY